MGVLGVCNREEKGLVGGISISVIWMAKSATLRSPVAGNPPHHVQERWRA